MRSLMAFVFLLSFTSNSFAGPDQYQKLLGCYSEVAKYTNVSSDQSGVLSGVINTFRRRSIGAPFYDGRQNILFFPAARFLKDGYYVMTSDSVCFSEVPIAVGKYGVWKSFKIEGKPDYKALIVDSKKFDPLSGPLSVAIGPVLRDGIIDKNASSPLDKFVQASLPVWKYERSLVPAEAAKGDRQAPIAPEKPESIPCNDAVDVNSMSLIRDEMERALQDFKWTFKRKYEDPFYPVPLVDIQAQKIESLNPTSKKFRPDDYKRHLAQQYEEAIGACSAIQKGEILRVKGDLGNQVADICREIQDYKRKTEVAGSGGGGGKTGSTVVAH